MKWPLKRFRVGEGRELKTLSRWWWWDPLGRVRALRLLRGGSYRLGDQGWSVGSKVVREEGKSVGEQLSQRRTVLPVKTLAVQSLRPPVLPAELSRSEKYLSGH